MAMVSDIGYHMCNERFGEVYNVRLIRKLRFEVGSLLRRSRHEAALHEEFQDHLERETERRMADGLPYAEARLAALRDIGGIEVLKEACRDARALKPFETFLQDFQYGLRQLRKSPGFAITVVLTLALGIAVNTTIFSVINSMILRKPPLRDPDRVVTLLSRRAGAGVPSDRANRMPVSPADFLDWRAQATSFSNVAARASHDFTLSGVAQPLGIPGAQVSAEYFQLLGVSPMLGRGFVSGEDKAGHDHVALLREDLWRTHFGSDLQALGKKINLDGEPYRYGSWLLTERDRRRRRQRE